MRVRYPFFTSLKDVTEVVFPVQYWYDWRARQMSDVLQQMGMTCLWESRLNGE